MFTKDEVLKRVREVIRVRNYSFRTEDAYSYWIGLYYDFSAQLPKGMPSEKKASRFITHLAVSEDVAASTQNQAFAAVVFLYKHVLRRELGDISGVRAQRPVYIREAPSREEVRRLLAALVDTPLVPARLLASMLYGCGLRVQEPLELRIKDVRLSESLLYIRGAKGQKDRVVPLPCSLIPPIKAQIERARKVWQWDRANRPKLGVSLPRQLAKKYPSAPFAWEWFWLFPAGDSCMHPRQPGLEVRWRLHEVSLQRAIAKARKAAGIACHLTPHVLRHGYATHSEEDPRTIQRAMGHKQLETTMGYIHRDVAQARSPLENLWAEVGA